MTTLWPRSIAGTSLVAAVAILTACGASEDDASSASPEQSEAQDVPAEDTQDSAGDAAATDPGESGSLTMEEVESNDSPESCWTVIDGVVYDVTEWIDQHPGGSGRIEQLCGSDGTAQFQGQHGGQENPEEQLAEFEIGELEN